MEEILFDIIICGGGLTGTVAALAFSKNNFSVAVIDPKNLAGNDQKNKKIKRLIDFRSTAHLERAVHYLDKLEVWKRLSTYACPLETLSIINVNNGDTPREHRTKTIFRASEIGKKQFGFNVPIEKSWKILADTVLEEERISTFSGKELQSYSVQGAFVKVTLSDGQKLTCRFLVGADGYLSKVRKLAHISTISKSTGQTALTFNIHHEKPHQNTSTEIYVDGGPFTIVPLRQKTKSHHSAVVWMQKLERANQLLQLKDVEFKQEVQKWSRNVVGEIKSVSKVTSKPVGLSIAKQIVAERVALIGEAAHTLPPIGAQGFNLSIKDISALDSLTRAEPAKIGEKYMLWQYQRTRLPDIFFKAGGVGFLNQLALSERSALQHFRALALSSFEGSHILKDGLMRLGLN